MCTITVNEKEGREYENKKGGTGQKVRNEDSEVNMMKLYYNLKKQTACGLGNFYKNVYIIFAHPFLYNSMILLTKKPEDLFFYWLSTIQKKNC